MLGSSAQHIETIIVGAGPAGLAVAACLKRKGRHFLILEKSDRVGSSWHRHYERLHLHTDKKRSELPYYSYPENYPTYPSRRQIIQYLKGYAQHFDLHPQFNKEVISAEFTDSHWETRTSNHRYSSKNLVVATGFNNQPNIPSWPGQKSFPGSILHSSEYSSGHCFRDQKVLVVGFGNSAGEIAIDLYENGAEVAFSIRSSVNVIPRDLLGIPILAIAIPLTKLPSRLADLLTAPILRIVFGDITKLGLRKSKNGPFTQIEKQQHIPLIDVGTIKLIREGSATVFPDIKKFEGAEIIFSDGKRRRFDSVILGTGYKPATEKFLKEASPDYSGENDRGLFFCGFRVTATGVLREISLEARQIAEQIANS